MLNTINADNLSDEELVSLALDSQDFFAFIINRYKLKLFNYIRRLTNISPEDTEDLLQEIFLKTYMNLNGFDTSLKFSSWIYSIARHQVISNFRKMQVRAEGHAIAIDDRLAQTIASEFNTEKEVDIQYLKENIFKILSVLDVKYREVLVLKFLEEKNYQEISDIIRRPIGTVGSLINSAKKEFKKELVKQNIKF